MGTLAAVTDPRYGQKVSVFVTNDQGRADLGQSWVMVSGNQAIAESIACYWLSPRGSLITNPDAGFDLKSLLGAEIDPSSAAGIFQIREQLVHEALRDERVESIDVNVSFDPADPTNQTLKISSRVHPNDPDLVPFSFVLTVSAMTVALIMGEGN